MILRLTEMQTSLQLHLLKSYSNLQKRLLLYCLYILRDQIQLHCYQKKSYRNAFPFIRVKILLHYNLETEVQLLFCTKEKL